MIDAAELRLLRAYVALGVCAGARPIRNDLVLEQFGRDGAIAGWLGYQLLCRLARTDWMSLPLIRFHGNPGTIAFSAADARFTESRPTPVGDLAVRAADGEVAPFPLELVNGDLHLGGRRPPFDPDHVAAALTLTQTGAPASEVRAAIGRPLCPSGGVLDVDLESLHDGLDEIVASARPAVTALSADTVRITNVPPWLTHVEILYALEVLGRHQNGGDGRPRLPIEDLNDVGTGASPVDIRLTLAPGTDVARVVAQIADDPALTKSLLLELPAPVEQLLARWLDDHGYTASRPWVADRFLTAIR